MVIYKGTREPGAGGPGQVVVTHEETGVTYELPLRHDLRNHSPDGFQWGYAGSGPAQLALALCAHALDDPNRAKAVYQSFKFEVVARIELDQWTLTREQVLKSIYQIEGARLTPST